ncbi:hypothetical protein IWW49_002952 [Coemansia sp. RSA 1797]|nr:hypothetical protein IWW35_000289 [Coemansia sp. RSA 1878]KAJ2588509.1 hypothetical protein IWW49_002952 [Coemansia sp. RSA 1797]
MLSNTDSTWHVPGSTPLVRSFRSSLYLRRRMEGLGPTIREGDSSARLSMPADVCDFLDLAQSGLATEPAHEGSHSSMLYALLSSLPEPPLSQPRCSVVDTLSALADELPQPPLSPTHSLHPPLSPPTSPIPTPRMASSPATLAAAVAVVKEQTVDVFDALGTLETPASSRRNTDEVPLSQQQELRRLSGTPTLMDEMPPESPFFADIADHDIHRTRDSIRNAKLARSRSLGATRSTWCAPDAEPLFASLHQSNKTGARASLAGILDAWGPKDTTAEWLSARPPSAADRCEPSNSAETPTRREARWFQVRVHSLFARGAAQAAVDEMSDTASTTSSLTAVEDDDPDMQAALARHPAALALAKPMAKSQHAETGIRRPTRLSSQRKQRHARPALSFMVSSHGPVADDRMVQSVDVEAMMAAYLPHIHAQLNTGDVAEAARERTASESSTLADPNSALHGASPGYAESQRSTSSEDTLQGARTPRRMRPPQSLIEQRRKSAARGSDSGIKVIARNSDSAIKAADLSTQRTPKPRLRQISSSANLRAPEPATERRRVHTVSQLAAPQVPATLASRRRSEVEALITQANAVLNGAGSSRIRQSLPQQRQQSLQPISRLRPPRASLPLSADMAHRNSSIVISPRSSVIMSNPRISVMSDSAVSRIPSPVSTMRSPATPLGMAMTRQHHRLDAAQRRQSNRSSNGEISPLALTPVHSSIGAEIKSCTLPTPRQSRPSISLSGLRPTVNGATSRIPATPAYKRPPPGMAAPRSASASMMAAPGSGGLAGMRRTTAQHTQMRRLGSSDALCSSTVSYGSSSLMHSIYSSDSDDSLPGLAAPSLLRRAPSRAYRDDEFLTLRPVHTPDIVPRTIDPRLVERAMTPMLKLNPAKQLASASSLSQMVQQLSDDNNSSISSMHGTARAKLAKVSREILVSVPEAKSPSIDQVSRMSPLNSPKHSSAIRPSTDSSRRFGKPGFLSRRWTKHSTSPVPVSAIPMPPPVKSQPAKKPMSSKIPSLKKARSLWSIRGLHSK